MLACLKRIATFWGLCAALCAALGISSSAAGAEGADPADTDDRFDLATGLLTIHAIVLNDTLYRAVVVVPDSVISYSAAAASFPAASLDAATGRVSLRSVVVGGSRFSDVVLTVSSVERVGSATPTSQLDDATRTQAASATANASSNACAAIAPFYWEVGDKARRLGHGSVTKGVGAPSYTADSFVAIASASKWLYGAYVAERRGGQPTADDVQHLTFTSGTNSMPLSGCAKTDTVASCAQRGSNTFQTPATVGKFYYNGGHMQRHGSVGEGMNLGALDNATLAAEMARALGPDVALAFTQPQLAGGIVTNATSYAVVLRKMLDGQLQMSRLLGSHAVCTNPATCASAVYSPFAGSFHYSLGHWVEDDPRTGDGALSSAGLFGFYPWIDASKTTYGVISRFDAGAAGAGAASQACGMQLRKAWMTGVAQF